MMTIPTPHRATGAWNATKKAGPAGNIHPMDVSITTPTRSFDTDGAEPSPIFWLTRLSPASAPQFARSEEHTSELQSRFDLVCRLLLEKKKKTTTKITDVS